MRITINASFTNKLVHQVDFIAKDSPEQAGKFKKDILHEIKNILPNPYKHRKSIYFISDKIRDLIFKGYTIVFRINEVNETIEIFGFVKYQEKP